MIPLNPRIIVALASTALVLCVAVIAAALLLLDADARGASTAEQGGEGGMTRGTSMAAAMIGDEVAAPGEPDDTDYLLDVPPVTPLPPGRVREFTLVVQEGDIEIAEGLTFPAWTFTKEGDPPRVPGPVLRMIEGERVRITLKNNSSQPHSLHTHGIHPASQDGVLEMVQPGGQRTYEFTAGPAGVMPYQCHAMPLKKHIGKGLYGAMIVDPRRPLPPADREMVMVMNGYDTNFDGTNEVYTVNGKAFFYAKYPIRVKRGVLNRIYLMNMTENDPVNSFHLHGNFFDYRPIGFANPPQYTDILTQIQGDRGIVDVRFPNTGAYMFHAHQSEFSDRGWMGFFQVTA